MSDSNPDGPFPLLVLPSFSSSNCKDQEEHNNDNVRIISVWLPGNIW